MVRKLHSLACKEFVQLNTKLFIVDITAKMVAITFVITICLEKLLKLTLLLIYPLNF